MLGIGKRAFWNNVHPVGAIADLVEVYRQAGKMRWLFMGLAAATTIGVFSIMAGESWKGPRPKPEITWINSWTGDRPDAEIVAENRANQKRKDKAAAEQAARDEKAKEMYRTLGRASGMDVDRIEREAKAAAAAEAAKAAPAAPPKP